MEHVIVVFPKAEDGKKIQGLFVRNGIAVDAVCTSGAQALEYADILDGGIIVCSYRFTDMSYLDLASEMPDRFDMLLIASQAHQMECPDGKIMKLGMPFKMFALLNTVHMMFEAQLRKRKKKNSAPKMRSEEEIKLIREAKGILMDRNHMTEQEAHQYLQKCSMDSGNGMVETAKMVLCLYRD